jgi:hypothetical protein
MIFHFTNRGDDGHNRTEFMNRKVLDCRIGRVDRRAANTRPAFAR